MLVFGEEEVGGSVAGDDLEPGSASSKGGFPPVFVEGPWCGMSRDGERSLVADGEGRGCGSEFSAAADVHRLSIGVGEARGLWVGEHDDG